MPRSSPRKADLQPGLRAWAYDLPRRAGASSGAPKCWLAADAATFASIYTELRPEERHAYSRLRAGATCSSTWTAAAAASRALGDDSGFWFLQGHLSRALLATILVSGFWFLVCA